VEKYPIRNVKDLTLDLSPTTCRCILDDTALPQRPVICDLSQVVQC